MKISGIKIFLRLALALGFFSAVADRLGFWRAEISAWGNWERFLAYTELINPWVPDVLISPLGIIVTVAEIIFAVALLIGFKTELIAKWSGMLILLFALAMTFSTGIKGALDYSVFIASGAAFGLSTMKEKYLELDQLFWKQGHEESQ